MIKEPTFTKEFYIETNQAWGFIKSQEELEKVQQILKEVDMDIFETRSETYFDQARPNFGSRREHKGDMTLREWMKK